MSLNAITVEHVQDILELAGFPPQATQLITPEQAQTLLTTEVSDEESEAVITRHQHDRQLLESIAEAGTGVTGILPEALFEDIAAFYSDATPDKDEAVTVLLRIVDADEALSPIFTVDIHPGYVESAERLMAEDAAIMVPYFVDAELITADQALEAFSLYVSMLEGHLYNAAHMMNGDAVPQVPDALTRAAMEELVARIDDEVTDCEAFVEPGTLIVLRDGATELLVENGLALNYAGPVFDGAETPLIGIYTDYENDDLYFYVEILVNALVGQQKISLFLQRDWFDVKAAEEQPTTCKDGVCSLDDDDAIDETVNETEEDDADNGCENGVCSIGGDTEASTTTDGENKVASILADAD